MVIASADRLRADDRVADVKAGNATARAAGCCHPASTTVRGADSSTRGVVDCTVDSTAAGPILSVVGGAFEGPLMTWLTTQQIGR